MKTYEPRRNNECPNGIHATYNPALDPTQNECTCPWLVIASSTPVQHFTSWSRRELENVIRETDRGYFDPPGYPLRSNSMFLSPNMQRLVDMAEKEPVAAALTLLAGAAAHGDSGLPPFDAIAWDAEDGCLSIRVGNAGGWRRLWLGHANVDALTDQDNATAGGASPVLLWADHADTYAEIEFRRLFPEEHDPEPAQDYFPEDITRTAAPIFAADVSPKPDNGEGFIVAYTSPPDMPMLVVPPAVANLAALVETGNPVYDQAVAAVEALPRRVPQVPSAIAEAGITLGGLQFPTDVPEDVFHAAQAGVIGDESSCPNCGQFLTAAEILGDMTTHDCAPPDQTCVCDIRGSAPDTYACPEHPADAGAVTGFPCDAEDHGVKCAKMRGHKGPHENSEHDQAWFEIDPR